MHFHKMMIIVSNCMIFISITSAGNDKKINQCLQSLTNQLKLVTQTVLVNIHFTTYLCNKQYVSDITEQKKQANNNYSIINFTIYIQK